MHWRNFYKLKRKNTEVKLLLKTYLGLISSFNPFSFVSVCVCVCSSHEPIGPQPYPVINNVVANPVVRGLLDRKI